MTILREEFQAVRNVLGTSLQIPLTGYYTNALDSFELVLAKTTQRGNMAALETARNMLEDFRPEVLLVVGIAGGMVGRGVALGDVVVPDYLHYCDFRSLRVEGDQSRHSPYDPPSVSLVSRCVFPAQNDPSWRDGIQVAPPQACLSSVHVGGALVAGEKVFGDRTHEEQIRLMNESEYSDAIAVDMESMGVAKAVHAARQTVSYNPRFLVIRGVSDPVLSKEEEQVRENAEEPGVIRERWRAYAAHVAAVFSKAVVGRILAFTDHRAADRSQHGVVT